MPLPPDSRRWETDERGHGVADARAHLAAIEQLAELAKSADWVTEDPDGHLLDKIQNAVVSIGWTMKSATVGPDGTLDIALECRGTKTRRDMRAAVWSVLGAIAELSTHVQETRDAGTVSFDVVTGIPPGGTFATHGHTLRIRIEGS